MVINDQPNMHMHALSFPCSTDSSCRQAGGDFKSSNQSDTCNIWRIFDTTSYTPLTLLPLPHRRSKHPRTIPAQYVSDHYFILGSPYQVIGYPLAL